MVNIEVDVFAPLSVACPDRSRRGEGHAPLHSATELNELRPLIVPQQCGQFLDILQGVQTAHGFNHLLGLLFP